MSGNDQRLVERSRSEAFAASRVAMREAENAGKPDQTAFWTAIVLLIEARFSRTKFDRGPLPPRRDRRFRGAK